MKGKSNGLMICQLMGMFLVFVLTACGGGDDASPAGEGTTDTARPTATITFPTAKSFSDGAAVTVRGTASDNTGVTSVSVNGVSATSTDGFATWSATIPVAKGLQDITVVAEDAAGNENATAATAQITGTELRLVNPGAVALDKTGQYALVLDRVLETLYSIDLSSSEKRIVSETVAVGSDTSFVTFRDMVFDAENERAYILATDTGLLSIDINTGARSVISGVEIADTITYYSKMALDVEGNRVFIVQDFSVITSVNLTTGAMTVVSDDYMSGNGFYPRIAGMAYDKANNRVLIAERSDSLNPRILAVNLDTGVGTVFSDSASPNANNAFASIDGIEIDPANNRLLAIDPSSKTVISVDLTTGERTIAFDASSLEYSVAHSDLAVDAANDRLLFTGRYTGEVLWLDLNAGQTSVVWGEDSYSTGLTPERLVLDKSNNRLLVADDSQVLAIDPDLGTTTVLSDENTPDAINLLESPAGIAFDEVNNRLFVIDSAAVPEKRLMAVDLSTGVRTIVSDNATPNSDNPFSFPFGIAFDAEENRVYVVDGYPIALISVDVNTGERTIISDVDTPNGPLVELDWLDGIALDLSNNRALITAFDPDTDGSIIEIDLTSGAGSIISDITISAENPFVFPSGIYFDEPNGRVLVTDWDVGTVFSVDLSTGVRTIISSHSVPDTANMLARASGIAPDFENNRIFVTDPALGGGIAVIDMTNGQRVFLAH